MKKITVMVLACLMILSVVSFAQEDGVYPDKVVIGSFQALSGAVAPIGVSMRKGMDAYFNWVNTTGGVHGRKIELIVADDQFNPSRTVIEVKRMVEQDKVFSIVGGLGSPGCLAVMDYLNDMKVPFVYQGGGTSLFAIPPKEYIFSVQPNYTLEGSLMAKYFTEVLDKQRIGIVYRADDAGKEAHESMKVWLAEHGMSNRLVAEIPVSVTALSFDNEIIQLMQRNCDAVALVMWVPQSPNLLKQAQDYGFTPLFLGSYANPDPTVVDMAGDAAEGFQAMAWVYLDAESEEFAKYIDIYQQSFPGEIPNAYAAAGFIAGEVFTEGLRRAGEMPTRRKLVNALETMYNWQGLISPAILYGPLEEGNDTTRLGVTKMYVMEVKDGVWEWAHDWISLQ